MGAVYLPWSRRSRGSGEGQQAVAAEDDELASRSARSLLDRALQPLNRVASKRFLREARLKVWLNTTQLQEARLAGPSTYDARRGGPPARDAAGRPSYSSGNRTSVVAPS